MSFLRSSLLNVDHTLTKKDESNKEKFLETKVLADKFDASMKKIQADKTFGSKIPDIDALLAFFLCKFCKLPRNLMYSKFCELALEVAQKGYDTNMSISESDFNRALEAAIAASQGLAYTPRLYTVPSTADLLGYKKGSVDHVKYQCTPK